MKTTLNLILEGKYNFPLEYDGNEIFIKNLPRLESQQLVLKEITSLIKTAIPEKSYRELDAEMQYNKHDVVGYISFEFDKPSESITVKFHETEQNLCKDCSECDGTGVIECYHCGNDMDCAECDGTGEIWHDEDGDEWYEYPLFDGPLVLKTILLNQGELF